LISKNCFWSLRVSSILLTSSSWSFNIVIIYLTYLELTFWDYSFFNIWFLMTSSVRIASSSWIFNVIISSSRSLSRWLKFSSWFFPFQS
jgi:hypothetical protein